MKIALLTDTHWGYSSRGDLKNKDLLKKLLTENPDIICHTGDIASECTSQLKEYLILIRSLFPKTPIVANWGNHCLWQSNKNKKPIRDKLQINTDIFQQFGIVHAGSQIYENEEIVILGADGWYMYDNQSSNDRNFIPLYNIPDEGFDYLNKRARESFDLAMRLKQNYLGRKKIIYMTHFGIVPSLSGQDNSLEYYGGDPAMARGMTGVDYLFFGHTHHLINGEILGSGTICYNSGSDYEKPNYLIISI